MTIAGYWLLAASLQAAPHTAFAKAPPPSRSPVPLDSPGDWIGSRDYPATALRFAMAGLTVFRLTVDAAGKPSRCDIVESSGFDALDSATCERLMAKARFTPSRDRKGKPVEGTYGNRVRWVLPEGGGKPVSERFASLLTTIDQTGKITSCRAVVHVPADNGEAGQKPCEEFSASQPLALGLELRGGFRGPSAEVELQMADVFTPDLRARALSLKPGYEQRALSIHRFAVTNDGKLGPCRYEEQRGSAQWASNFCLEAARETFDPPFAALDKDGVATGWHIARVLLKTGP